MDLASLLSHATTQVESVWGRTQGVLVVSGLQHRVDHDNPSRSLNSVLTDRNESSSSWSQAYALAVRCRVANSTWGVPLA